MTQLFANNAKTRLNAAISNVVTEFTVATGEGALFPNPGGSDYFLVTFFEYSGSSEINHEVVKVTGRTGDTFTMVRAQEGTTALAWADNSALELRVTKETLDAFHSDGDTVDVGALTATSATVNGNIIVTGNVDGRDVANDGGKLDLIEASAKDDQSAAEVVYSTATSGLAATDVQAAIDEVEGRLDTEEGHDHTGVYAPVLGGDDNYVTDAEKTVVGNTSGANSGDNATNTQYSGLVSDTGTPAIHHNAGTPVLEAGTTAAEVRSLIGAGTSSFDGTYGSLSGAPNVQYTAAISNAATGVTGLLTGADWDTFAAKQVALGFTPYNATNPSGYTSNAGTVTSIATGTGLDGGFSTSGTITLDFTELALGNALLTTEHLIGVNGGVNTRQLISEIPLSIFSNDAGFITSAGATPAITSNGSTPSLNTGITGAEVRSLIGAGTSDTVGTVTSVAGGTGVTSSGGATPSLSLNFAELTDMTANIAGTTEFIIQNGTTESRKAASEIQLSHFTNDLGWDNYSHPTHPGDDFSLDSGALTGATVVSDIDINVTTDTLGHVTDANGTVSTRNLTAGDIGAIGASGVTYGNLSANSDIGTGSTQVSQGNHTHAGIVDWTADQGATNIHTGNYTNTVYSHPSDGGGNQTTRTGASVYSDITINTAGHVTGTTVRDLTAANVGAAATTHNHTAAQTTSGTFASARMPYGTSSTTVAYGNHTHSGYALTSHGNHVPTVQGANNAVYLRNDNSWQTISAGDIGAQVAGSYASSTHQHDSYDRVSSVLANAAVFSNIVVTNGIVTNTATRNLTAANIGAATSAQANVTTNISWTAGTTSGPRCNSSDGSDSVIPSASGSASGAVVTGNQTFGGTKTAVDFVASSDRNLKSNILYTSPNDSMELLMMFSPVTHGWHTDPDGSQELDGFIAQDVQQFRPDLVTQSPDSDSLSLSYGKIVPIAVGAIKQLKEENDEMKAQIARLTSLVEGLL